MDDRDLALDIRQLAFEYPDGTEGLRGVDLRVARDRRVGLVGANGAGKSTLLLHLNGLLRGTGSLSVLGLEASEANVSVLRRKVGLVFQNPDDQLFMPTVFDEVAYAAVNAGYAQREVRARVAEALGQVGLAGIDHKHPVNLSIGQKKRVAIASVLVTDNELLVLDEPSAGLDPAGRRALIALLDGFETTIILATHDLPLVDALCDTVAVMRDGQVARVGPTAEVLSDDTLLAECGL